MGRSQPNPKEEYHISHQNIIEMENHVLQFGYSKNAIFLHFHEKGNLHRGTQIDLIKHPPLDIIRLEPSDVQLLLERLVWADASRETIA